VLTTGIGTVTSKQAQEATVLVSSYQEDPVLDGLVGVGEQSESGEERNQLDLAGDAGRVERSRIRRARGRDRGRRRGDRRLDERW